jgi:hypothetical protein
LVLSGYILFSLIIWKLSINNGNLNEHKTFISFSREYNYDPWFPLRLLILVIITV